MTATVLVVEDEALIAGDIQRTLTRLGYAVPPPAGSGEKAIDDTIRLSPDLVLMDIKLRGKMDGIQAATTIRSRFDIPIVYLTSHSDETTLERAKATNPHGYLLKPFSDRELRTAIEVALHRHDLEVKMAGRERWFATTLRSIGDAVIATDERETITFLNGVAEKLTGWGQEAVGRPVTEVFNVVDRSGAALPSPVGLALARSFTVELPPNTGLLVKSGKRLDVDDSASPIIDDRGTVLGGVVVFRDVTERHQLEARLVQSERLASLGTMAAGVAHEINNPLTYVISNIEVTIDGLQRAIDLVGRAEQSPGGRGESPAIEQLRTIEDAMRDAKEGAQRVRQIVQDLRKFARGNEPTATVVSLQEIIEVAVKMTAHAIRHHARIRLELGATPDVDVNEGALGQVFTNLLLNAAQAIGDGRADQNEIVVSTHTDANGAAVAEVSDTGPGIPVDVLPRLFDPFFTTKPIGSGMGVGLTISHNIVTEHGGTISAENRPGGGALFRIVLPAARRARPLPASPTDHALPAPRMRVLVVDDEAPIRKALARILENDHDVTLALDGADALDRLSRGEAFDVVLCDLMMPNVSGIDLYESLVVTDAAMAGRIVFITGGAFSVRAQEFLATVPNRRLAKPFAAADIRKLVRDRVP